MAAARPTGDDCGENDGPDRWTGKGGGKRTPRKIDTAGLRDVPEAQRVDPLTGQQLVHVGEHVFEELDFIRAPLTVICRRWPIYGLPPAEAKHREIDTAVAPACPGSVG
jgi:hypothetical protein